MKSVLVLAAFLGSAAAAEAHDDCAHEGAPRAVVDAQGARRVEVRARAGFLHIDGRPGATAVEASGLACAPDAETLRSVHLSAERRGDRVVIEAHIPDGVWFFGSPRLDLTVNVPASVEVDVRDGSGELTVRNVAAVRIEDGSGSIAVRDVPGTVEVTDGSGSIEIRDAGAVEVRSDGSGSIAISRVRGHVRIARDGSGSIDVDDVAGDFTVDRDGSGGIRHARVRGQVRLPDR